jgi:hypothetical protein
MQYYCCALQSHARSDPKHLPRIVPHVYKTLIVFGHESNATELSGHHEFDQRKPGAIPYQSDESKSTHGLHRSNERVAAPFGDRAAAVYVHAGRRDVW